MEAHWFYLSGTTTIGPIRHLSFIEMFTTQSLDENTLVWNEEMVRWERARNVNGISRHLKNIREAVKDGETGSPAIPSDGDNYYYSMKAHPWRRYFARIADLYFIMLLIAIPAGFLSAMEGFEWIDKLHDSAYTILSGIVLIPLEAIFIPVFGTTFGKWLFNIRVVPGNMEPLNFFRLIKRSFHVWYRGFGVGIGIIALFSCYFSYKAIKEYGTVRWDDENDLIVQYGRISPLRLIVLVAFISAIVGLIYLGVKK